MTKNFKTTTPISQVNNIYSQSAFDYEAIVLEDTVQNTQAEKPNTFPSTSGQVLTASLSKQNRSRNAALSRTATNTGNKYQDKKQMATKSKLSLSVKSQKVKPLFFNGCFDKTRIKRLVAWSLQNCGQKLTIDLIENLKNLGFSYATHAGISLGIDDLKIPPTKNILLSSAEKNIKKTYINHEKEYLTGVEKFQHLIDTWHRTSEVLKQDVISHFKLTDILNPVYMMAFSGARGNVSQVRQLVGMRGLMSDPQGQILDFPIKSNFREGITLTEYIISCYGARKGLVDTALKTANSGYLTRRLVDVSHHIIISDLDCKTKRGVLLADIFENKKIIVPLKNRLVGRILAENIYSNNTTIGNTRAFGESANSHIFSENPKGLNSQYQNVSSLYQVPRYFASFISASQKTYHPKKRLGTKLFRVQAQSTLFFYLVTKYNIFDILYKKTDAQEILENQLVFNVPRNTTTINSANKAIVFQAETTKQVDTEYVIFSNYLTCYTTKKKLLGQKNQEISVELSLKISNLRKSVLVRSPLTCRIKNSICQLCYGWSLAHSQLVSLGEAVGVLAAQSIGEPGTQLTMRTFHTGGVFSGDIMSEITAPFNGKISFSNFLEGMLIRTPHGKIAFLTKVPGNFKIEKQELQAVSFPKNAENLLPGTEYKKKDSIVLQIPAFTVLFVRNAEYVNKNQVIAEFSSMSADANQRIQASQDINSEIEGEVYFKNLLLLVRKKKKKLISRTTCKLGSMWILSGKICQQPIPINLFLQPGDLVNENSIIAQYQTMSVYSGFNSSYSTLDPVNKNRSDKQVINSYSVHQHKMGLKQNISKHIVPGFDSEAVKTKLKALKPQTTFGAKHPKDFWYKAPQVRSKIQPGMEYKIFDRPAIWKSDHVPGTEISGALRTLQNQVRSTNSSKNLNFDNKNWLGYPLLSYSVQSIQYKKVGYLFSFFTKKKLQFNFLSQKIVTKSLILCKAESPKGLAFGESLKGLCEAESPKGLIEGESPEGQVPSTSLVFAQHSKPLCGHVRSTSARNAQVRSTLVSNKDFVPTDFTGLSLKQPVLKQHRFFLSNSLKQNFLHSNNLNKKFFLQSFPIKYQTKTGGKIIYDTFYFNKKKYLGEVFWIQQEACLLNRKNSYINLINYLLRVFTSKQASGLSTSVREAHRYRVPVRAWDFVHSRSGSKESIVLLCEPTIQTKTISGLLNKTNTKFISQNNLTSFYYNAQGRVFASYSKLSGYTEYSLLSRFIHNKIKQAVPKAKNNSLKKFSKTPVIPNNSEIQEKPEVRSEIQPRTEYQGLMLDKCTIKKAIQNNKVYSFNYKFYQICFHLNPCITISCKARRTLK